ncbi:type II toxin-antitoxin system prevent-host-death family antitoxin, partial [Actinophytocola sp.]|uniref:type II toxin-antitoxin system Phd/YefM family antitoxin n=1 Tax=Actinophytocola sp. TaxID=1872138 RepID=UPI002D7E2999
DHMRSMTTTEAAQNFDAVLDEVEHGEVVLVTKDGRPVARIVPERLSVADRLAEVMERYPADPDFGADLERVIRENRELMDDRERKWPWADE